MGSISINNYSKPVVELTNEDRRFVELINNRITIYGQIPYTVPDKLIIEIIKESGLYFYRMGYWRSQHVIFYRLDKKDIIEFLRNSVGNHKKTGENPDLYGCGEICETYPDCQHESHHIHSEEFGKYYKNLKGYGVKLPPFVNAVREIYETNKKSEALMVGAENDYSTEVMWGVNQSGPYGYQMQGINANLYVYEKVARMTQQAAYTATLGTSVPFRYNNATKVLIINKTPTDDFVSYMLQCDCNVPIQELYVDDLFIKYVIARCKQELRRLLGSHTIQLPGEVTLNVDDLCYNADTDVQSVEEVLKGSTGIGDIILQR